MRYPKLDNIDLQILMKIQKNCKITNLQLSKEIGLSPAPTLERVKKLEQKGVIMSYNAAVNPRALGLNFQAFIMVKLNRSIENSSDSFIKKVKKIPAVIECDATSGDKDFILHIACKTMDEYSHLLTEELGEMSEIAELNSLLTLKNYKKSYVYPIDYEKKNKGVKKAS